MFWVYAGISLAVQIRFGWLAGAWLRKGLQLAGVNRRLPLLASDSLGLVRSMGLPGILKGHLKGVNSSKPRD